LDADDKNVAVCGFPLPPLSSFLAPLFVVIVFLAAIRLVVYLVKSDVGMTNQKTPKHA
jgi:hypothetical protein